MRGPPPRICHRHVGSRSPAAALESATAAPAHADSAPIPPWPVALRSQRAGSFLEIAMYDLGNDDKAMHALREALALLQDIVEA